MAKRSKTEIEKTKEKALELYLESNGEMSVGEIAAKAETRPNVVGAWIKKEGWHNQLKGKPKEETVTEKPARETKSKRAGKTPVLRKRDAFDKALRMFRDSDGKISNSAISNALNVGMATVAKWKKMPQWTMEAEHAGKTEEKIPARVESIFDIKPAVVHKDEIIEALRRIDKTLDGQIQESIGLKTEIRFLIESIKRRD
jgi:uncharacterized protein YjcR